MLRAEVYRELQRGPVDSSRVEREHSSLPSYLLSQPLRRRGLGPAASSAAASTGPAA
ncbi:hypothetical protein ACFYWY_37150 [Streptomyces sp. NPDC002870]|uniref:hypothetical protein n=1 Tax=Streptomyces sp. NPDC002870 TaxID=3364666 RepID=UPI0036BA6AA9